MNLTTELIGIVQRAHSLDRIVDDAAGVIATRLGAEGCFVFVMGEHGRLAPCGSHAPRSPEQDVATEVASIAAAVAAERRLVTARTDRASLLGSPMLLRDSMVGTLVIVGSNRRDFSAGDLDAVAAVSAQLAEIIENARIIDALDRGESPSTRVSPRRMGSSSAEGERTFAGLGASPGIAIGSAIFRGAYRLDLAARDLPAADAGAERARVRSAIDKTYHDISRIQAAAAQEIDEEHALIFASHLLLLGDSTLLEAIDRRIGAGSSAPVAIDAALAELEAKLGRVADAYLREKMDDVDDLRNRLLDHVLDQVNHGRLGAGVVVTSRIPPSLVIELKTEGARALVTQGGGVTSHGVLLARAMGIPVVTGVADMLAEVRPGDPMVVDGTAGAVVVRPTASTLSRYTDEQTRVAELRTEHAKYRHRLARTSDGVRVTLYGNVGIASDLAVARDNGAEGVGLYRTELPFIVRDAFPTRTEQVRIYGRAYEVFPDRPVYFRLLDLAGDKFVAGGSIAAGRGAFDGYRSIRVLLDHPHVFREQVQAFALAAGNRTLRILVPMVTALEEFQRVKVLIGEAIAELGEATAQRAPQVGAMIEMPAAVEIARELAAEADFLSIGTNDLAQYTLVVDREDARMASMVSTYHPAILRMVARVVDAAREHGKPVSVCGEMASRPDVALAFVALGVDALSVVPTAIPELKQALARARLEPMQRAMAQILALGDASSVAAALREAQRA